MDRKKLCSDVERCLSLARLNGYKLEPEADTFNAIARYLWNITLCEALYPTLQAFEVSLRNAIHDSLSSYYRPDWLLEDQFFRDKEWDCILNAEGLLSEQGKLKADGNVKPDDIVAELPLGFWTGLFVRYYDRKLAIPTMNRGLKGFPDHVRTRDALYKRFDRLRFLRNRVFHHEPIWHWGDLPQRHKELVESIGYINPTKQELIIMVDRFEQVHAVGWKQYRTQMGELIAR
jgi:hypothetical protein